MIKKPNIVTDKHLEYLDALRESGITNMWGAGDYLRQKFGLSPNQASEILSFWMDTFSQRHEQNERSQA